MTAPRVNEYTVRAYEQRWHPMRPHPVQMELRKLQGPRFRISPAGRRSGKTECAKRYGIKKSIRLQTRWPDPRALFGAPTQQQAERIFWGDLKRMVHPTLIEDVREGDRMIKLVTGHELWVLGMDAPARVEGFPWDFMFLDEFPNMRPGIWDAHVRPALMDRAGEAWLFGVPEGGGTEYQKLCEAAQGDDPEWGYYHWRSEDIQSAAEIESVRSTMDELTYEQEIGGRFIVFHGRAYYKFDRPVHAVHPLLDRYDPLQPLIVCFDFNVSPGVACVGQEMRLPNGEFGTGWIGEVYIPRNSNTEKVAREITRRWHGHQGEVWLEGDATGGSKQSAALLGNDWDIVREVLKPVFGRRLVAKYPRHNPTVRSRINAVNSRLMALSGEVRMMIDPKECPHLVNDLENTVLNDDGSNLEKRPDTPYTHQTDAIGYYIVRRFPVRGITAQPMELRGV